MTEHYRGSLRKYILASAHQMTHEPTGVLRHPYTVPATPDSPYYADDLWDWDSWLISVALGQVEADTNQQGRFFDYERGCIQNFLEHSRARGFVPVQIDPHGELRHGEYADDEDYASNQNMHKPVLAQHAALLSARRGSAVWVRESLEPLAEYLNRYLTTHRHQPTGLSYWQTDFAVGVDNDPSVFYRPPKSCGSIFLNSLLYRELLAYAYLLEECRHEGEAKNWRQRAAELATAVRTHCWDERDGTFYSVDLALRSVDPADWLHHGAPRTWDSILLRIDSWSSFMPLWSGIASPDQAARMVERYRDDRTFHAPYGVRTLSPLEKMYNLRATNNPSNWLGPIWGISNYLVFRGLLAYGFSADAEELAERTIRLFGRDLEANGHLHEYYDPDSGAPIMTPGFQNWNYLVLNMIAQLDGREVVAEF